MAAINNVAIEIINMVRSLILILFLAIFASYLVLQNLHVLKLVTSFLWQLGQILDGSLDILMLGNKWIKQQLVAE
jgi:hypothetical protein